MSQQFQVIGWLLCRSVPAGCFLPFRIYAALPAGRTWDLLDHQHQLGGLDHPGRGNSIAIGLEEAGLAPNMPHREPLLLVKSIEDSDNVHMWREHRRFDTGDPSLLVSMPCLLSKTSTFSRGRSTM